VAAEEIGDRRDRRLDRRDDQNGALALAEQEAVGAAEDLRGGRWRLGRLDRQDEPIEEGNVEAGREPPPSAGLVVRGAPPVVRSFRVRSLENGAFSRPPPRLMSARARIHGTTGVSITTFGKS